MRYQSKSSLRKEQIEGTFSVVHSSSQKPSTSLLSRFSTNGASRKMSMDAMIEGLLDVISPLLVDSNFLTISDILL